MSEKLAIDEDAHELKLGRSFDADGTLSFHSMYFDFKPASIDTAQPAVIDIEQGNKVKVTVPHIEGSSTKQTVYCGSKQPSQKDFALIINHKTGEFVLERLTCKLNLKRTRSEKAREIKPSVTKHQKPAAETDKQTDLADATVTMTKVKQEEPVKASCKNKKLKPPPAAQSSTGKKASLKSDAKRDLSASSSSEALSSSSSSSSDDDDAESGAGSEPEDKKPQSGSATRGAQPSKSSSSTNFNICDDLQLSESDSSSESD